MSKVYFKYRKPYEREINYHEVDILEYLGNDQYLIKTKEKGNFKCHKLELLFK